MNCRQWHECDNNLVAGNRNQFSWEVFAWNSFFYCHSCRQSSRASSALCSDIPSSEWMSQYKEAVRRLSRIDSSRLANSLRALPSSGLSRHRPGWHFRSEHMLLTPFLVAEEKKLFPSVCTIIVQFSNRFGRGEKKRRFARPPGAILFAIKFISLGFPQGRRWKNKTDKKRIELNFCELERRSGCYRNGFWGLLDSLRQLTVYASKGSVNPWMDVPVNAWNEVGSGTFDIF